MKKLFILLFIFVGCQRTPIYKTDRNIPVTFQTVNVGTTANDHTGDPLRTAFQKQNNNWNTTDALFGTIYSETETRTILHDSIDALRDSSINATGYFFTKADSNSYGGAITRTWFETYGGGGGGGSGGYEWTSWIVGTTSGAPANADTSFTITDFGGDRIELYRGTTADLHAQWLNETATNVKTGYRYNAAGVVVVRPPWSTGDRAYLRAVPSSSVTKIALTGGGGGSSLLTGLVGFWQLNESSGSVAADVGGTYNGTTSGAAPNATGKFGTAYSFDGVNDFISMGTTSGLRPTGDFTVSLWMKTTQSTYGTMLSNYIANGGNYYGFKVGLTDAGVVEAGVYYGNASPNEVFSTTTVANGAWHNVIFTYTSSTDVINVYVDGGASEDNNNVSGTITYHASNDFHLGDRGEGDVPYLDWLDCVGIWSKVISSGERTILQNYTHPFE